MSTSLRLEAVLRVIAETAAARLPLAPALREQGGSLGQELAAALDRGEDLPSAFAAHLPAPLRALLGGPRPPLAEAALLAAEQLQQDRRRRSEWLEALLHPLLTLACIPVVVIVILTQGGFGLSPGYLAAGVAMTLLAGALLVGAARSPTGWGLPLLARWAFHRRMSWRYERAALVARWRLPDAQLAPLLGDDLASIAPLLAVPQAEGDVRRLAAFHRDAARRCHRHLALAIAGLLYIAGGILFLAAAVEPMQAVLQGMLSAGALE